jgi:hypothetical protein
VDGKPMVLSKTFVNGSGDDIKPLPPVPPTPDTPLAEWVKTQLPVLVKSQNMAAERQLVAQCFEQVVQKIDNATIKTAQNARTQLQIALTMTLAFASDTAIDDWQPCLTALSQQMSRELGDKVNDINAVKSTFKTVAETMKNAVFGVTSVEQNSERKTQNRDCEVCPVNSTLPPPNFQQSPLRPLRLFR